MGREGWLYAVAFLAILAAGAALIVPRLLRMRAGGGEPGAESPAPREEPPPDVVPAPAAERAWLTVRVEGEQGALVGPLKRVYGAQVKDLRERGDRTARLLVRPDAELLRFGAAGHLWIEVPARSLAQGAVLVLPEAAPTLIVRVRETDGLPAADVPLEIRPRRPGPEPRTDAGGTVVLDDLPPGLVVVGVGGRERRGPTLRLLAGRDRDVKAVLEPAWRVSGRVLDGEREPVAGALVEGMDGRGMLGARTATDGDGRFTWAGPVTSSLALRITNPGRAMQRIEVSPPSRGPLVSSLGDIVLTRPVARLEGRVLAAIDAQARITVEPAVAAIMRELFGQDAVLELPRAAVADEEGVFVVGDVDADVPLRISIRGAGQSIDDVIEPSGGLVSLTTYTPPPGHELRGTVKDAVTGRPAAGVTLRIAARGLEGDEALPGDVEVVTDGAGRFHVQGLPRGRTFLRAYVPDRRTLLHLVTLPRSAPVTLTLERLTAAPARRIHGRVVDDGGAPLEGVTVQAAGRRTRTAKDGGFQLEDIEGFGDQVGVTASYEPGTAGPPLDPTLYVGGARRLVTPGGAAIQLVLSRAASLTLQALDGIDDAPLTFLYVLLKTSEGQTVADRPVATRDGVLRLEGMLPVGGSLVLLSDRHRANLPVMLEPGSENDLGVVRLSRGMHITGRIENAEGGPVPGAYVGGTETGWLAARGSDPTQVRELALRRAVTNADGRFVLDGFDPKAPAVLAVWAPGFAPAARRVVLERFQDDVHIDVKVRLQHGGWLAVELRERGTEEPVSGALFDLEDARNGSDYLDLLRRGMLGGAIGSDEDWRRASRHLLVEKDLGRYHLGPIEPGPYEVWVDHPEFRVLRRKLTVLDPTGAIQSLNEGASRSLTESLYLTWELEPGR